MNLSDIEKFAHSLAIEAGSLIKSESDEGASVVQTFKNEHELVTSADIAVDKYICHCLLYTSPSPRD